jgi:hypothetical protein
MFEILFLTADILGMQSDDRRFSVFMPPQLSELDLHRDGRSPSPDDVEPLWKHSNSTPKHRYGLNYSILHSCSHYAMRAKV